MKSADSGWPGPPEWVPSCVVSKPQETSSMALEEGPETGSCLPPPIAGGENNTIMWTDLRWPDLLGRVPLYAVPKPQEALNWTPEGGQEIGPFLPSPLCGGRTSMSNVSSLWMAWSTGSNFPCAVPRSQEVSFIFFLTSSTSYFFTLFILCHQNIILDFLTLSLPLVLVLVLQINICRCHLLKFILLSLSWKKCPQ